MKTPREKYKNDPEYRHLVDLIDSFIEKAAFTPSEIREAATLACINYEMRRVQYTVFDRSVTDALKVLEDFYNRNPNPR